MEHLQPSFSRKEQHIFLWFHNCRCGGELKLLGRSASHYKGKRLEKVRCRCTQCGKDKMFLFEGLYESHGEPAAGYVNPPEAVSTIVDPVEWLHAAMHCLHLTEDGQTALAPAERNALILDALGCIREALKFIPANADRVPASALGNKLSRAFAREHPGILTRASIEEIHDRLVALVESLDTEEREPWWKFWQHAKHAGT